MVTRSSIVRKVGEVIRKVCNPLVRDFHEIQRLQGYQNLSSFVQVTHERVRSKLLFELDSYNAATGSRYELVVFPIDGRENFFRGISDFTVSVLIKKDGKAFASVVELPMTHTTFYAELSSGAYLEDLGGTMRLKIKNCVAFDITKIVVFLDYMENRLDLVGRRMLGCDSLAACYVASCRGDALLLKVGDVNPELLSLIRLLIAESGGKELRFQDVVLFAHLDLCEKFKQLLGVTQ
ncbi:inositol monophosphatase family protein [Neorickettsia risticii]|uniref:Inositol monophosphatase family protein n=1 Tax=Neorickettsia risticii (strain Illinois) TaxID=434131 RepID=C6V5S3_NEORI|nr:inositol monophosphatase family protein [Neorickettsia risticii]ACT69739.1 inositol monophosphatase family protein [Neorickettsia risticii str. Illinois]